MLARPEVKKRKEELNRRALFSIKTGNSAMIKKYMFEILTFEADHPMAGKVVENADFKIMQESVNLEGK